MTGLAPEEVSVTTTPAIAPSGAQVAAPPGGQAARPQLIRELNEQLLLGKIRQFGPCSRADLARLSGLSKPTVSLAMSNVERSGLIRAAGHRTGVPGRSARLYEIRPDAGFVLGLDIGQQYLRGALADLTRRGPRPAVGAQPGVQREQPDRRAGRAVRRAVRGGGRGPRRDHPDRDRQPRGVQPAAGQAHHHRRAVRLGQARGAERAAGQLSGRTWWWRTTRTRPRWPSRRSGMAAAWTASRSSPSAPASAWAWC